MENGQVLVSVIIPVFNSGIHLKRCLDSVAAQTWRELDVILVDDGSSDGSSSICDYYALIDNRFHAFHTANRGPGAARNFGLEHAAAKFVCFIDSDDWCEPGFVASFFREGEMRNDLVIQGMVRDHLDAPSLSTSLRDAYYDRLSFPTCFADNNLLVYGGPCCKLFKKSILTEFNIQFPVDYQFGEDLVFFLNYVCRCNSIRCYPQAYYHYVEQFENTLSSKVHDSIPLQQFIVESVQALNNALPKESSQDVKLLFNNHCLDLAKRSICNMYKLHYNRKRKILVLSFMKKHVRGSLHYKRAIIKNRVFLWATRLPVLIQLALFDMLHAFGIIH